MTRPFVRDVAHPGRVGPAFDPDRACYLDGQVVVRPAPHGCLAYHFGTSRAVFFAPPELSGLLAGLGSHPSLRAALDSADLAPSERSVWEESLASLASAHVIRFR